MLQIKSAIGICHYTLKTALLHCKTLQPCAPNLTENILRNYNTFRVMGCFICGLHQIFLLNAAEACKWLSTADTLGKQCGELIAPAVQSMLDSTHMLKLHALTAKHYIPDCPGSLLNFIFKRLLNMRLSKGDIQEMIQAPFIKHSRADSRKNQDRLSTHPNMNRRNFKG